MAAGDIQNGQSPEPESGVAGRVVPEGLFVGPTRRDGERHRSQSRLRAFRTGIRANNSGDSAHMKKVTAV